MIIKGDTSGNGKIGAEDYLLIQASILFSKPLTGDALIAADVNGDGVANAIDISKIQQHLRGISIINEVIK